MTKCGSKIIGTYIRKARMKQQLSMEALSKRAGISSSQISLIERGRHTKNGKPLSITLTSLEMIAKGIEMTVEDLLERSGYFDFMNQRILAKIDSLTDPIYASSFHYYALNDENKAVIDKYIEELLISQENESSHS